VILSAKQLCYDINLALRKLCSSHN
jgi:hypothetical protein